LRNALVKIAWHIDPDLEALGWTVLDLPFSNSRRNEFLSWAKYDKLYRQVHEILWCDEKWRQGPKKCWTVAQGPLRALSLFNDPSSCRVLDFGCGSHFPDSTGLILYLTGAKKCVCLEQEPAISGFLSGQLQNSFAGSETKCS